MSTKHLSIVVEYSQDGQRVVEEQRIEPMDEWSPDSSLSTRFDFSDVIVESWPA